LSGAESASAGEDGGFSESAVFMGTVDAQRSTYQSARVCRQRFVTDV